MRSWVRWLGVALAWLLSTAGLGSRAAEAAPPIVFTHGVASGDVTPSSVVLWTRVIREDPRRDDDGDDDDRDQDDDDSDDGEGQNRLSVRVEVALDPAFRRVHFRSQLTAHAENDFTVKVVTTPLLPSRQYYYRWRHGSVSSPIGTFRTAPPPDLAASFRFTWTGDSDGTRVDGVPAWNNFEVLDAVRAENADFFLYLGDTVYIARLQMSCSSARTITAT